MESFYLSLAVILLVGAYQTLIMTLDFMSASNRCNDMSVGIARILKSTNMSDFKKFYQSNPDIIGKMDVIERMKQYDKDLKLTSSVVGFLFETAPKMLVLIPIGSFAASVLIVGGIQLLFFGVDGMPEETIELLMPISVCIVGLMWIWSTKTKIDTESSAIFQFKMRNPGFFHDTWPKDLEGVTYLWGVFANYETAKKW